MIYIAIDNSTSTAKKMIKLIEEMPFATVYKGATAKAFKELKAGKTAKTKQATGWWEDEKVMKELAQRDNDMETGKDSGISWGEAKKQLLQKNKK